MRTLWRAAVLLALSILVCEPASAATVTFTIRGHITSKFETSGLHHVPPGVGIGSPYTITITYDTSVVVDGYVDFRFPTNSVNRIDFAIGPYVITGGDYMVGKLVETLFVIAAGQAGCDSSRTICPPLAFVGAGVNLWQSTPFPRKSPPLTIPPLSDIHPLSTAIFTFGNTATAFSYTNFYGPIEELIVGPVQRNLRVTQLTAVQAVASADKDHDGTTDLVVGKPAFIRAKVLAEHPLAFAGDQAITFRITAGLWVLDKSITFQQLQDNDYELDIDFTPLELGDVTIRVMADSEDSIDESNEDDNALELIASVRFTRAPHIAFVPVCVAPGPFFAETAARASAYIRGLFPVAPDLLGVTLANESVCVDDDPSGRPASLGWNHIWRVGQFSSGGLATNVVGLTSNEWMNRNAGSTTINGYSFCSSAPDWGSSHTSVVRAGRWDTVAHEVGHTFGLSHEGNGHCGAPIGVNVVPGYWNDPAQFIAPLEFVSPRSLMEGGDAAIPRYPNADRWITKDDYEHLFRRLGLTVDDPELLLITGVARRDGRVELLTLDAMPSGVITGSQEGTLSLEILGRDGRVLHKRPFSVALNIVDSPRVVQAAGFGLSIPFVPQAHLVRVSDGSAVLSRRTVESQLLRDAVLRVPDAGFSHDPANRRRALLNKIDAFERALQSRNHNGDDEKLRHDIRERFEEWLVDDYPRDSVLNLDRTQVLELVDELIARSAALPPIVPGDLNFDASVTCEDLAIVKSSFGLRSSDIAFDLRADVTGDGTVDIRDLSFVSRKLPARVVCR